MRLSPIAWANVALHALGLVLAATAMRAGTPLAALDERMAYLGGGAAGWRVGWAVWAACALALVTFLYALARRLGAEAQWAPLAFALAAAGAAIDLACDATNAAVLPSLARGNPGLFLAVERAASVGGALVANGLYALAVLLVSFAWRAPPSVKLLAAGVFVSGVALAVGGAIADARVVAFASAPTIGLYCLWTLAAARALDGWGPFRAKRAPCRREPAK